MPTEAESQFNEAMLNIYRRAKAEAGSGSTTGRLSWAPSSTTWAPPARRSARRGRPWTPTCRRSTPTRSASCWSTRWRQTPSLRLSYVRKDLSGDSGIWNTPQQTALLAGRGIACTADPAWDCPLNALTGAPLTVQRVPDDVAGLIDNRIAAFPGMESAYDTLQASVNRRFTGGFLLQASVDYQWRDEFRAADSESRSPLYADPLVVGSGGHGRIWQNHGLDVDARQATTNWNARLLALYTLPYDVGLAANLRHQSGWPYALIQRVDIPGTGNEPADLLGRPVGKPLRQRDHGGPPLRQGVQRRLARPRHPDARPLQPLQCQRRDELLAAHRRQQTRHRRARPHRDEAVGAVPFLGV